jgi:hypothetical protein
MQKMPQNLRGKERRGMMTVDPYEVEELIQELEKRGAGQKGGEVMDEQKWERRWAEYDEQVQDRQDAQRYRKLKEASPQERVVCYEAEDFDAAVDALPEPK